MLKIMMTEEMTNSYIPKGFVLSTTPYPAYRATAQTSTTVLNFASGFDKDKPSKIIITKKGNPLLVNCLPEEDEKIMLLTLRGGFRSGLDFVKKNVDIIIEGAYSDKHCTPVQNLVIRFKEDNDSFVLMRSGRRSRYFSSYYKQAKITWNRIFYNEIADPSQNLPAIMLQKQLDNE